MICQITACFIVGGHRYEMACDGNGTEHEGMHTFTMGGVDPMPVILFCPNGHRHVDGASFTKPHHTHACQTCGIVWRPMIERTVGAQFLPGYKDDA
jgi:hypothetical protein